MTLSTDQIKELLTEPEYAAQIADLVYINDRHLTIHRKKYGRGFSYLINNSERVKDKDQLKRIKSLVIPPAWQDVRISELSNGHLQVVGRDEKHRKVYLYHDLWTVLRNQTKFFKMSAFAKALPPLRKQLENDLGQPKMSLSKCLALVVTVMDQTNIRVGSQYYADKNKTYGLSTLRTRHVVEEDDHFRFEFTGKKGVQQTKELEDEELIKMIKECEEISGWELFQYYDENGKHHAIDSSMINAYIREIAGDIFSAKDFRTWGASREFFEYVSELDFTKDEKLREKQILEGFDAAAEALGNTRAVCRKYYVHPQLPSLYQDTGFKEYHENTTQFRDSDYFSKSEKWVKHLIDSFEIKFREEAD
ncbi:MAG: DNA topoisomerase IB [Nonlabens sp.]